jgi:DNA polymerase kappa
MTHCLVLECDTNPPSKFFGVPNPTLNKNKATDSELIDLEDQDQDDDEDFMPGYHEHEWEADADEALASTSTLKTIKPHKPVSAPASSQPSSSSTLQVPAPSIKPKSSAGTKRDRALVSEPALAVFACPICTGVFTDNDALNAHIDWCLSRDAIRTAQAEGNETASNSTGKAASGKRAKADSDEDPWWKKPPASTSNAKRKKR